LNERRPDPAKLSRCLNLSLYIYEGIVLLCISDLIEQD